MVSIAGFASNRGRNLRNLDDLNPGGATVDVVVSNNADAPILEVAAQRDIPTVVVERDDEESRRKHERRILAELQDYSFDLVCMDGYMRILSKSMLDELPLTINVHPSLLPLFRGKDAWTEAIDAGVSVSGCTVHVVTEEVDSGPIITQEPVDVYPDDTVDSLKERILYEAEFKAYPRAVKLIAEDRITVADDRTSIEFDEDVRPFTAIDRLSGDRGIELRYGENPHQAAAVYADPSKDELHVAGATCLDQADRGLSYNNFNDADVAYRIACEFDDPAASVIKHAAPAGVARSNSIATAYEAALATDPMSAFGGIVGLNRECDLETAIAITDSFKEVVVAPGYSERALGELRDRSGLRILEVPHLERPRSFQRRSIAGGHLVQEWDDQQLTAADLEVVTENSPTSSQRRTMEFAWTVAKHATSNAIVLADGTETVGIGQGQVSRVDAVKLATRKADEHAEDKSADGAVLASDGFFPFPDGVEAAAAAGVKAIVQPGGSKNDDKVIRAADELGLAMAFTGQRCFRH